MPVPALSSTAVVVTELFPPAVGGTPVLMENVYSRLAPRRVIVLTDAERSALADERRPDVQVVKRAIAARHRGLIGRGALGHHLHVAGEIRALVRQRPALVHTVRVLPEGLEALLCRMTTGVPYACWCHGEDVTASLTSREFTFLMRRVLRHAAAVFANSQNTRQLLEVAGIRPDHIVVVHPGVDTSRFHPDADPGGAMRQRLIGTGDTLLLSVGRLERYKGHDLAIQALAALVGEHPGLRYVIIGDGSERRRLEDLASDCGVRSAVVFAGEVSAEELPACYSAADLFLLPGRVERAAQEGFGIVFLEAAASGLAAIGGRSGGVSEAIDEGTTGLLVSGDDVRELAERVGDLLRQPDVRRRFSERARERVLRDFTWERASAIVAATHDACAA